MADDLKPLINEMRTTNALTTQLLAEKRADDTPGQIIKSALPEIFAEYDSSKTLGKKIDKELEESDNVVVTELGFLAGISLKSFKVTTRYMSEMMNFSKQLLGPKGIMGLTADGLPLDINKMAEAFKDGVQEYTDELNKDFLKIEKERQEFEERTGKTAASSDKEKEKKKVKTEKGYFAELKDSLTSGYKALSDSFSELSSGIIGKAGFATGLLLVVSGLLAAFPRLAEMTGQILTGIGNFFSDIGLFLSGDLTLSEFANRNPLGIVLASFFAMTESAKKLFDITKAVFFRIIFIPLAIINTLFTSFDQGMRKFEAGGGFFGFIGSMVDGLFTGVAQFIKDVFSFALGLLPTRIQEFIEPFTNFVSEAFQRVIDALSNMNLFGFLGDTIDSILGYFTGSETRELSSTIEPKAMGGAVAGGSPYLVGEKGPELFVPGAAGGIIPNGMGGAPIIVNNNQVNQSSNTANHQHSNVSITDSQQEITGL